MKNKKIALITTAAMALVCLAACKPGENPEDAIRKVVTDYYDAKWQEIDSLDERLENTEEFIVPDSDLYEETEEWIEEGEEYIEEGGKTYGEDNFEEYMLTLTNAGSKNCELEIKEVVVEEDTAEVTVRVSTPDAEEAIKLVNEAELKLKEEYVKDEYGITLDSFVSQVSTKTQSEQQAYVQDLIDGIWPDLMDEIEEIFEDEDLIDTEETTVYLEKVDDKWLITKIK